MILAWHFENLLSKSRIEIQNISNVTAQRMERGAVGMKVEISRQQLF